MRTVIASDLHLGTASARDLLRHPGPLEVLTEAFETADRVVLLGDVLELRDSPLDDVMARAEPILRSLGQALAGKPVTITAGNHDHEVFQDSYSRNGAAPLGLEHQIRPEAGTLLGRIAAALPDADVTLSYPGVRIRDDVWATHGHYLDVHNTVPAIEAVFAQMAARRSGRMQGGDPGADDYEAVLSPIYGSLHARAQRMDPGSRGGDSTSLKVLKRLREPRGRIDPFHSLLTRVIVPGAVGVANLVGTGNFSPDFSGPELRRAGLRAIGQVVDRLDVDAEHVVFGHTHRRGPMDGDVSAEWITPGGRRLHNTGSWVSEPFLVGSAGRKSPYWPGGVVVVEDDEDPRFQSLLGNLPEAGLDG
ncbi:MAG: hypothetical protein QOG62_1400 [Thermoleophilaceae bacterium]|jgi:predicted phosphodiesterase|nr:hypothetical protein [Thermoleophilaceae bacterium]